MFAAWKQEKTTAGLVAEAQALADKLAGTKPHIVEAHAAAALLWQAVFRDQGQDLHSIATWPKAKAARFAADALARIAVLRKARDYDSSDGLAVWMHSARTVAEPRIADPVRQIWAHLAAAGPNAASMAEEQIAEAGLAPHVPLRIPEGFDAG
ncbi:MAG: hypothetical protein MEQ74_04535 [Paracoccus sp.]|nr:hypothetical protein [Paracoccus sp. (in: a-proteobacteria)]